MSDSLVKILKKRIDLDGNEEYLIEYFIDKTRAQEWKTSEEMSEEYQQLLDEFSSKTNDNRLTNSLVTNGDNNNEKDVTQEENGFDRGFRPFKILGAKHDNQNRLMFLVMFREDLTKADLIPNYVLHQKCPQLLIKFYEKNTLWKR